jgi:ribokinase
MDASVEGRLDPGGPELIIADPEGVELRIIPPEGWPGPLGRVVTSRSIRGENAAWKKTLQGIGWRDDLGGMGAGYAKALGGTLFSALGTEDDPVSTDVLQLLMHAGIHQQALRSDVPTADWTLLISSGAFGDKLPIGFRGCHDSVRTLPEIAPCELLVLAALPNRLLKQAVRQVEARIVFLAPAMRNVIDRTVRVESFVDGVNAFSCNRSEWQEVETPETILDHVAVVAITDGPRGCDVVFHDPESRRTTIHFPAFPRSHPPRDTNRAGEAFASTLVKSLLESGWEGGAVAESTLRHAAERAMIAASLVLDRSDFGFPTEREIDHARSRGVV